MCEQVIKFCNGSTKPLLFVGAGLTLLLAIAIDYTAFTTHALYSSIDVSIAQSRAPFYYLQLAAGLYLSAVAGLSCFAAHYNQKHSIRALAVISTVGCVLALAAVVAVPSSEELGRLFVPTLGRAKDKYNISEPFPPALNGTDEPARALLSRSQSADNLGQVLNATLPRDSAQIKRQASADSDGAKQAAQPATEMSAHEATCIWDRLQARGCCGLINANDTWKEDEIPKSCCARSEVKADPPGKWRCEKPDSDHQRGCLELIGTTSLTLNIVLVLIALANLYLATVSVISTYKTFHYSEASQSAYT